MNAEDRIKLINQSANDIVTAFGHAFKDNTDIDKETADAIFNGVRGLSTIITVVSVSLVDIAAGMAYTADCVGRLVELAEQDTKARIEDEAEAIAEAKVDERAKRSFIGQKL